ARTAAREHTQSESPPQQSEATSRMELPGVVADAETGLPVAVPRGRAARGRGSGPSQEPEEDAHLAELARDKEARRKLLLDVQRRQHAYLHEIVEEEVEAEKRREVQWQLEGKTPAARKCLKHRFHRERAQAKERIQRIKDEHELVLAAKMAQCNLLR
ncbi:Uncharacterized protein SCF082_LOCUS3809, partial [Durusdinium trenchii]